MQFYIEWGDGTHTDWTGSGAGTNYAMIDCASGETIWITHTYLSQGTYTIRAKARDTIGEESDWGYFEITIPKIQNIYYGWLERFPRLQKIMDVLRVNSR